MNILLLLGIAFPAMCLFLFAHGTEITRFTNGRVLRDGEWHLNQELWVAEGKIIRPQSKADKTIDVNGLMIVPGYIDIQINGGFGIDCTTEPEKVGELAKQLTQYGVTSFLPTVISAEHADYGHIIRELQPRKGDAHAGASILGIHLEGPFFQQERKGAHVAEFIIEDVPEHLEEFYGSLNGVRIITLAPELAGAVAAIKNLKKAAIIVSIGHSSATYEQALQSEAKLVTHLYNAMTPFHHRAPGIIGFALADSSVNFSIIVDGIHMHPAAVKMAWNSNPKGLILITDAIAAVGLPEGIYKLGAAEVEVQGKAARIAGTETLAGSILTMDQAVRNLHEFTGCSIEEAIEAATLRPAKLLGIENQKGTLNIGADADFLLLDDALNVKATYIGGEAT